MREDLKETDLAPAEVRRTILQSMTRTLFVAPYADAYDNGELPKAAPHAGPGDEWFVCAPQETPAMAARLAEALMSEIEQRNNCRLEEAYSANARLGTHLCEPTAESFGHYLAMESLGSGVGWADDHPDHDLDMPRHEVCLDVIGGKGRPATVRLRQASGMVFLDKFDGGPLWLDLSGSG